MQCGVATRIWRYWTTAHRHRGALRRQRRRHSPQAITSFFFALFAAAILVLSSAPALAFRTASDSPSFKGTAKVRWQTDELNLVLNSAIPPGIDTAEFGAVALAAVDRWSTATGGRIAVNLTGTTETSAMPGDGVSTIQYLAEGWTERGYDPNAPGITDIVYVKNFAGDWTIEEADIYLNGETHDWVVSGSGGANQRDLDSVLTHEAGHLLGLWHPCEEGGLDGAPECDGDPDAALTTMYPLYSPSQATLAKDDIAGINFLYGVVSCEDEACPFGSVCTSNGCAEECGDVVCNINERCTADGCWPSDQCYGPGCDLVCEEDSDCGDRKACLSNQCTGIVPVGETCRASDECQVGLCTKQGLCISSCADCEDEMCVEADDGNLTCNASKLPVGAECNAPEDCFGNECLVGAKTQNVCTRRCTEKGNECPQDWTCSTVDDARVCAPTEFRARGGSGCAISSARLGLSAFHLVAVAMALAAMRKRHRRDRCNSGHGARS